MSSSRQPSDNFNNNNNSTYQHQLLDYEIDESSNLPRSSQQPVSNQLFDDRDLAYENGLFQQMYPFQDDGDDNLPDEIVAELEARNPIRSNVNDEDDSVFSDAVQNAFKKYQNEYSKYWKYDDTIWENKFSDEELSDDDEEQEELLAQMEECWNYMTQDSDLPETSKNTVVEQDQESHLNPDANEFKPSWLKASSTPTNEQSFVTLTSTNQLDEHEKKF